jgi:hypothetical protein
MPQSAAPLVAAHDISRTRVLAHLLGDHPVRLLAIELRRLNE